MAEHCGCSATLREVSHIELNNIFETVCGILEKFHLSVYVNQTLLLISTSENQNCSPT
jgi:hypothetical protein